MVKFVMKNGVTIEVDTTTGIRAIARNMQKAVEANELYFCDGEKTRVFIDPNEVAAVIGNRKES